MSELWFLHWKITCLLPQKKISQPKKKLVFSGKFTLFQKMVFGHKNSKYNSNLFNLFSNKFNLFSKDMAKHNSNSNFFWFSWPNAYKIYRVPAKILLLQKMTFWWQKSPNNMHLIFVAFMGNIISKLSGSLCPHNLHTWLLHNHCSIFFHRIWTQSYPMHEFLPAIDVVQLEPHKLCHSPREKYSQNVYEMP